MKRRDVMYTTSVVGLSGCLLGGETSDPTRTPSTCESGGARQIRLADFAATPDEADVEIQPRMGREQVSSEATATLELAVANRGGRREVTIVDDSRCHFFNRDGGRSEPRGLWLYRAENAPADRVGECWTKDGPPASATDFESYGCGTQAIGSGETIETTYEVWDDHTSDDYMPTGTYRFSRNVGIWPETGEEESRGEPDHLFEWWLDLEVSREE